MKPGRKHDSSSQRRHSANSPWRKHPHCDTKKAEESFKRYQQQGKERKA